jgi:hypothetical protein
MHFMEHTIYNGATLSDILQSIYILYFVDYYYRSILYLVTVVLPTVTVMLRTNYIITRSYFSIHVL